jgi:hypothetical protein
LLSLCVASRLTSHSKKQLLQDLTCVVPLLN